MIFLKIRMMRKNTYVIAEIGQNHNGSVETAKSIIELVALQNIPLRRFLDEPELVGFNAVKTTIRDLDYEMAPSEISKPYESVNSFGSTYASHRKHLELTYIEHSALYKHAKAFDLDFIVTLCAPKCLDVLNYFKPDKIKVASRDLSNIPLLRELAQTKIPIIISTGMADIQDIDLAVNEITKSHSDLSILHCNSIYPVEYNDINLLSIQYIRDHFNNTFEVGFSDHTTGILAAPLAVALGATIIEKHVTLSRHMKGSDQLGSLSDEGMYRMLRDIRQAENSIGHYQKDEKCISKAAKVKLERSLCAKDDLLKGRILTEDDFGVISPGSGCQYKDMHLLIGKKLKLDISKNELIFLDHVE